MRHVDSRIFIPDCPENDHHLMELSSLEGEFITHFWAVELYLITLAPLHNQIQIGRNLGISLHAPANLDDYSVLVSPELSLAVAANEKVFDTPLYALAEVCDSLKEHNVIFGGRYVSILNQRAV